MTSDIARDEIIKGTAALASATVVSSVVFAGNPLSAEAKKKRSLGQFFTHGDCWLRPQIKKFIAESGAHVAYDPFAGDGCLLRKVQGDVAEIDQTAGLDIDKTLGWKWNDSLENIPHLDGAITITNPPYISNYSARRKRINESLDKYFRQTEYDDVYLLALDKMLAAQECVVAIIPETFINSPYRQKSRLKSITILEENPFSDTDTPVVVVCFDARKKAFSEIAVYKDSDYICTLKEVEDSRIKPSNTIEMRFNAPNGWLAVRCVDTTSPDDMLRFAFKQDIDYDWARGIKVSSRLLTLIDVDVPVEKRVEMIGECNRILRELREKSHDIILSPFKGNMKNGVRRRRLDFLTCRAIVEKAYLTVMPRRKVAVVEQQMLLEAI